MAVCVLCGIDLKRRDKVRIFYCNPCEGVQSIKRSRAQQRVTAAIRRGLLLPVTSHVCVDCGAPAKAYDHRDYDIPLAVEPVCDSCNTKRGPATGRLRSAA